MLNAISAAPQILLGLPHLGDGALLRRAKAMGAHVLISANSLSRWRRTSGLSEWTGWNLAALANARGLASLTLDSAGFTAMLRYRGYPWPIAAYLDLAEAFPFRHFAAPDYCTESEIASDRQSVRERIARTVGAYHECRRQAADRAIDDRLMPVLQGRTPHDYERCADGIGLAADSNRLVGVGSMCRRPLGGATGLIAVLEHLDAVLPPAIRLHGFGVKGAMLSHVGHLWHRLASVDSQAYGVAARRDALKRGVRKTDRFVATHMTRWLRRQGERLNSPQRRLRWEAPSVEPQTRPESPWDRAVDRARDEIHALIAAGELDHDALFEPWVQQWAAELLGSATRAPMT